MGQSKPKQTTKRKQTTKKKRTKHSCSQSPLQTECLVRESRRAKHVSIKISTWGEVEVVVPVGFDQKQLPDILSRREEWIQSTRQRMLAERAKTSDETHAERPHEIALRSIDETWTIHYDVGSSSGVTATITDPCQLSLSGHVDQVSLCQSVLSQWIRSCAEYHLLRQLNDISQKSGLPYRNLTVRRQKTRWGSCSNQHNINLNDKLLFLPSELVRYVLVHELCHTIHLNHSKQFWALVAQHEPDYRHLDRELRTAWRYVPQWLEMR